MNKEIDVVALGELLIDFTNNGLSEHGNPLMEANPGGAPCNVLAMLSKLNHKVAFIGKVDNDGFGRQLEDALIEQGIITAGLCKDNDIPTTLAIVLKQENGDRDFSFYRKPGADMMLKKEEINEDLIKKAKIFHFGSLSLTDTYVREATQKAIMLAKENNCMITFDPNLRPPLWSSLEEAHRQIAWGLSKCDVLKISDNEILWFTNKDNYDDAVSFLRQEYPNIKLICLSLGADGSRAYYKNQMIEMTAFKQEGDLETTGCGDTFCGCLLDMVLCKGLDNLSSNDLEEMLRFANGAAAIVATRKGALRVMPTKQEIETLIKAK